MKRLLLFVLIGMFFSAGLSAQRRSRGLINKSKETQSYFVFSVGPEYCYADPTEPPFNQNIFKNYSLSLGYRKLFPDNFGYRAELSYGNLTGTDLASLSQLRRYSFSTKLLKMSVMAEYSIILGRRYYYRSTPNAIYAFFGVGLLSSNANLNYDPKNPIAHYVYKQIYTSPVVPFGGGYRYDLNNGFMIGVEVNYNFPFSDYIDGFKPPSFASNSTKMISKSNDLFVGVSFSISYLLESAYLNKK